MEQKIDQYKWIWPSLIVLSAGVAGVLAFTNSVFGLRPLFAMWFLLVCPGMAFVQLLPIKQTAEQWTLAIALSLALDAFVAAILVYAHIWSPNVALMILIAASLFGVSLQILPERWLALRKPLKSALRVDNDELLYRKGIKSINNRTSNHKRAIGSTARAFPSMNTGVQMTSKAKILLVGSDGTITAPVRGFMGTAGYEMRYVQNGDEALNIVAEATPDLILLDVVSPSIDGWKVLRHLREISSAPIIILTSIREKADIVHGFQLGADDYMTKPLSFTKLEARVESVLSSTRIIHISDDIVTSKELTINFERQQVISNGREVNLTPTEYHLLETLARHANRTIPLGRLLSEVRGSGYEGEKQYIKYFIWSLRRKIEPDPSAPKHLITRRGYGYRFE